MVYDGTKSGLNDCLYAPWFFLPDADVLLGTLDQDYCCIDNEYGEMFLNFWIHPELLTYSGMDLTPIYGLTPGGSLWLEVWTRCPMGQSPSPYSTIQQTRRLKRFIFGDPKDTNNVFYWSYIQLNLPGSPMYHPGEPWISKRRPDGLIAADAHDYVNDLRGTAPTSKEAWQVGSKIAKTASFFGAARKRREQTMRPGAWVGVVCGTHPDRPFISVTPTKWEKAKSEIARLRQQLDAAVGEGGDGKMDRKTLEQVAGYLNHIARAFPTIKLYLNGVYATMNAWRPDRNKEGWRLGRVEVECNDDPPEAPKRVRMVSRIKFDIEALEGLTAAETPPERNIRPAKVGSLPRYCFADATGSGLGVSQWSPGDTEVEVDYGSWGDDIASNSSSNFRELGNIEEKIEHMDRDGRLSKKLNYLSSPIIIMQKLPFIGGQPSHLRYFSSCSGCTESS